MAPRITPAYYVAKIAKYRPGDPRRDVAERRAVFAIQAARAGQAGDMAGARRALEGLHGLGRGLGEINPDELAALIRSGRGGSVSAEEARRAAATITTVVGIIDVVMSIIGTVVGGDVGKAILWVNAILVGRALPEMNTTDFQNFCRAGVGMRETFVNTAGGLVVGAARAALMLANIGRTPQPTLPTATHDAIYAFFQWVGFSLNALCTSIGPLPPVSPPGDSNISCVRGRTRPDSVGLPQTASSCCPGFYLSETGTCEVTIPERSPVDVARRQWVRAVIVRRSVEVTLADPRASATAVADANARDSATSSALCAAETALLAFVNPLPAWGTPATAQQASNAMAVTAEGGRIYRELLRTGGPAGAIVAALLLAGDPLVAVHSYLPPVTQPRCYIRTPPTAGCRCPRIAGPGGGGGGGGALVIGLPLLLWMFMAK
jgi:hypothetical protein